jgi:hypothetical protein
LSNEWILSISKEKMMLLLSGQSQKFGRNYPEVSRSPGFEIVSINRAMVDELEAIPLREAQARSPIMDATKYVILAKLS